MNDEKRGIIIAFIAVFLWSTLGAAYKLFVPAMDSFLVALYVGFFATILLLLYLVFTKKTKKLIVQFKQNYLFFIAAGIIGLGVQQILYLKAYQVLPASQVIIIFYLYPLLMVLLSGLLYKEKTTMKSMFFVLLGFFGVYVLISKGTFLKIDWSLGVIVTLFAALAWALFSVMIKHKKFDADIGMFLFNLFGFLFLVAMIPVFGLSFDLTAFELSGILYIALVPTAISFVLWNQALHMVKTSICSNIALLTPLISVALVVIIIKEQVFAAQLIGLFIIISSVFLNLRFRDK